VNVRACPGIYQGREVIILATNDVTESMEKDAQLIQASKMKSLGEMSAGIAHELNQPLNAIKMGNDFLILMLEKGRVISPEKLAQVAKEVSAQVSRASEIIRRLRDFARKADFSRERFPSTLP
jgi:C4-dicarboxylate-specific signal transduction histidine kinase